ncbi:MAG: PAS domain S-box protein, partial [Chloroflexota bacterium]
MTDVPEPGEQDAPDTRAAVRSRDAAARRPLSAADLRRQAEERLAALPAAAGGADDLAGIHVLRVHQIELEMQNDELSRVGAELDASRAFYREHYDFAPLGYCTIDASEAFLRANLAAATMLGVPRSRLVHRRFSQSVAQEDLLAWHAVRDRVLGPLGADGPGRPGDVETCELRMARPDGTPFWAHLVLTAADEDGVPVCHVVLNDISARRLAEEAARESEERYRSVVAAMSEGVVLQMADGSIAACNAGAQRILGLTEDEMLGRTSVDPRWRSVHEDGSPFPGEEHPAMVTLRTGQAQSGVVMGVHTPDGRLTWISVSSEPLRREPGAAPHAAVTTFLDITERKLAADQIARREAELKAAQRMAHVGSWELDVATGVVTWSDEMCRIFGLAPGSPVPSLADQARFFSREAFALMTSSIEEVMATGEPFSTENEIVRLDGIVRHVTVDGEAIRDAAGAV